MAGCGFTCCKYTLFFLNAIFWLIGAGILAIGIWLRVDSNILEYLQLGDFENGDEQLIYAAYFLIAAGGAIFIIGFCGCCGAIRESQCLLGFYIICMLAIIGLEIAAGVYAYIKRDELLENVEDALTKALKEDYGQDSSVTYTWNKAMMEFKCCGVSGIENFIDSKWMANNASGAVVPQACCVELSEDDYKKPVAANDTVCQVDAGLPTPGAAVHKTGCADAVKQWLRDRAVILIGVGLGVAAFEIIILIMALCVCCQIRRKE